jgi:peptidoglycan/LPS O-acetylase OafA/YrhL
MALSPPFSMSLTPQSSLPIAAKHERRTNASLQGLRGLAAFSVLMFHLHLMSAKVGFTTASTQMWVQNLGAFAVSMFFCISGYLIVNSLTKHGNVRRFALNRVARVYPLFIILHVAMFSLGPWMNYEWMGHLRSNGWSYVGHFFSNLFFLPGMTALPIAQKNAWSLSYEAAFYLLVGTIFVGRQNWSTLMGKVMFALGWLACIEACVIEPTMTFFAVGALVWWLDSVGLIRLPALGPVSAVSLVASLLVFSAGHVWLSILLVLPFFADVVREKGWMAPLLQSKTMGWFGKISYSLYLVHPFVLDPLRRLGMQMTGVWGTATVHTLFVVAGAIIALGIAALSHEFIEVRLTRRLLRRA